MLASNLNRSSQQNCSSEISWQKLYSLLRPVVKRLVYSSHLPSWKGQEEDVVDDIVQEAITRLFQYSKRVERGEVAPIDTIEHMIKVIALNYGRDLKRRERRLSHSIMNDQSYVGHVNDADIVDPAEIATDKVFQEWLFERLSQEIVNFPKKQRNALLIDLTHRMQFVGQTGLLQRAFLRRGIRLQEFRTASPKNALERGRHAANLSLAYKRVANVCV